MPRAGVIAARGNVRNRLWPKRQQKRETAGLLRIDYVSLQLIKLSSVKSFLNKIWAYLSPARALCSNTELVY